MILKSLQIKGVQWDISLLSERTLVVCADTEKDSLSLIHSLKGSLEASNLPHVRDIIPAYESIAIVFEYGLTDVQTQLPHIEQAIKKADANSGKSEHKNIPVCYEFGLDWPEIEAYTSCSKVDIIATHSEGVYTLAMMGFLPGFLYLSGLDESIACPRKKNPRTKIPSGAVGIGGEQTGIYSIESPGGWQIIGRTPVSFFDVNNNPPVSIKPGDTMSFFSISKEEFETYSKKKGEE